MSKTDLTMEIEQAIYKKSGADKPGIYGCFECTLGKAYGNERIDYITMDSQNIFRCYEIKASVSDLLYSKQKLSFVGDYNYLVLPNEVYEEVKDNDKFRDLMFNGIGVYTFWKSPYLHIEETRSPKKKALQLHEKVMLMHCMIRSLSRYCKCELKELGG